MSNARTLASLIDDTNTRIKIPSGYGLDFADYGAEDSNSATIVGSNLMDDYEEGTFSASLLAPGGVSTTFVLNTNSDLMSYTKIGNRVFISGRVIIDSVTSPSGDEFHLGGLPFTIKTPIDAETGSAGSVTYYDSSAGSYLTTQPANVEGLIGGYPNRWRIFKTVSDMGANDQLSFSFTYLTS